MSTPSHPNQTSTHTHNSAGCVFCEKGVPLAAGVQVVYDPERARVEYEARIAKKG